MRRNATDWKEIFPKDKSNKGLIFKVHKEVFYLSGKKRRNVLQPGVLPQLSHSQTCTNMHMKGCSICHQENVKQMSEQVLSTAEMTTIRTDDSGY